MTEPGPKLKNPPIVEAVLDIECDLPPSLDISKIEMAAREKFRDRYPKMRTALVEQRQFKADAKATPMISMEGESTRAVQAYQFTHDDEKQFAQVRRDGFTFSRLAPSSSLDDYLPEVERTWKLFSALTSPVQIRIIRLRYINRIFVPIDAKTGGVELEEFFSMSPKAPIEGLTLRHFLTQVAGTDQSGNEVSVLLTGEKPFVNNTAPIIVDITTAASGPPNVDAWSEILQKILILRELKNLAFHNILTERCLQMFRQ